MNYRVEETHDICSPEDSCRYNVKVYDLSLVQKNQLMNLVKPWYDSDLVILEEGAELSGIIIREV